MTIDKTSRGAGMSFTKILAATDGSSHGRTATRIAGDLAGRYTAKLLLAHVMADQPVPQELRHMAAVEHLVDDPEAGGTAKFGDGAEAEVRLRVYGVVNGGVFLQIADEPTEDLEIPEADYTFGRLIAAQSYGDQAALRDRGRPVGMVKLGPGGAADLPRLKDAISAAFA